MRTTTYNPATDLFSEAERRRIALKMDQLMARIPPVFREPEIILLSQQETAELLGVSERTLRNWKEQEHLLPVLIKGNLLYQVSEIRKFLKPGSAP